MRRAAKRGRRGSIWRAAGADAERLQATERLAAAALESLLHAIDANDADTGAHVRRVAATARTLAEYAGCGADMLLRVERVALFHDIGKIDAALFDIVHEGERLTSAQKRLVRSHPARGESVVAPLAHFYPELPAGVRAHHERWDGKGYPDRLAGTAIPFEARLVAIADVFDALTHRRRYRRTSSGQRARDVIAEGRGAHFDPELADLFLFPPVFLAARRARTAITRAATGREDPLAEPDRKEPVPEVAFRWRSPPAG